MIKSLGHAGTHRRVAINVGSGFVPGTNAVVMGAAIAGGKLGWEMIGIRNGFEGLLFPDRFPGGGMINLSPELIENLDPATGGILGQAPKVDPFHAPSVKGGKKDLSDQILKRIKEEDIDALISIVSGQGLGILQKLHLKGLHTVCIPRSIENDIANTAVSFGFNSALSVTIEMLNKAYQAARSASKIAVVEVPGEHAGWIALQAGIAVRADAVLMPEIPCDLKNLAKRLKDKISVRRPYGLVVVAEGAKLVDYTVKKDVKSSASPGIYSCRPGGRHCCNQASENDHCGNLSACNWRLGPGRKSHRNRPSAGNGLWCRICPGAESRTKRGDGFFYAARYQVCAIDRCC